MNIVLRIILNFWAPQNKKNQVKIEDSYSYFMYKLLIVWIRSNKVGRKSPEQGKPTKMVGDELRITPGLLGGVSPGKSSIISMCLTHR